MLGCGVRKTLVFCVILSLFFYLFPAENSSINSLCRRTKDIAVGIISYYNFQSSETALDGILQGSEFRDILTEIAKKGCRKIYIIANGNWPSGGRVFSDQHALAIEQDIGFRPEAGSACIILPSDFTGKFPYFEQREILAHELSHILKAFDSFHAEADYIKWRVVIDGVNNIIFDSHAGDEEALSRLAEEYLPLFALRLEDVALLRYQIERGDDFSVQSANGWADSKLRDIIAQLDQSTAPPNVNRIKWQFVLGYYCSVLPFEIEGYNVEARKEQLIKAFSVYMELGDIYSLIIGPVSKLRLLLESGQYPFAARLISALQALP